jgi:hypothetical protein
MVHPSIIEARLGELRFRSSRWFRAEVHELQHILMDHEKIIALACGRYFGSFALLVATDQRLLLVDKRVFFMNIEDTRYDMISEIDFNSQVYSATVTVHTINKTHKFTSIKHKNQLRLLTNYVQRRVMEFRTQQSTTFGDSMIDHNQDRSRSKLAYGTVRGSAVTTQPAFGTSYNYSPTISDEPLPILARQLPLSSGVVQGVGSTAMQATRHSVRPRNPYVQGSLMTRAPTIANSTQPEY